MTPTELAARLEAEKKLEREGWMKKKCLGCEGLGHDYRTPWRKCYACDGTGYVWEGPGMR